MSEALQVVDTADTQHYQALAGLLKAAADPLRLEILRLLAQDSFGVLELSHIFDTKQSGMSHHLKVLANAGLVASRREGNSIFYRRALPKASQELDSGRSQLLTQLFDSLEQYPLNRDASQRLAQVQQERAQTSRQFFSDNSDKFHQQQDLIASYPNYADQVVELLDNSALPAFQHALEIGPGAGECLQPLAARFEQVVALDNAPEMLQRSQQFASQQQLGNIEFILGESNQLLNRERQYDCTVINMVLHHVPSPAAIFADVGQLLKPGGSLLVTDLCSHNQQWAKEACGDLWLGFDPDDLSRWALSAGLHEQQSQYIALRNGFQIQIRQFLKSRTAEAAAGSLPDRS